ncbi:Aconitase/3-isopropylmalate dehydratase large subunit, alpha/beta/alpha, subdomain 1/3 [Penicillium occitanis (nom. inval.)]|nr:Aconitase/3-isopropylmalate dehydratase large subunit, alpha/beta/alpha, subdomain 1/3 [Penicillium occitanis (nom. inval.)]PCG95103.1 hypothetical protein PENOC_079460 [Penicillium occitanis (nom. inval.)]
MADDGKSESHEVLRLLHQARNISLDASEILSSRNILGQLKTVSQVLQAHGYPREATAVNDVLILCEQPSELGGLGLDRNQALAEDEEAEIIFLISAWLEALNSADRTKAKLEPLSFRPAGRRGMTLSEKIFAMHDVAQTGSVKVGDLIRVDVDWVIASEASWAGMEATYNRLGQPGIFRNDRFWLAGDHVIDPRVKDVPQVKALVDASERAKRVFKMTEYQGMNVRYSLSDTGERAQPGMLVIGSDSHTCSSGALGCLAIGLGAADVTLPLVTGETWFKVPESVNVRLIGSPKPGIGGKDVILYILQQLKRNTVASERIVEYTGPGLRHLSSDARFAISNMTTELGGITGIFVPDEITLNFVQKRLHPRHKNGSIFLKPDDDVQYAETYEIDLGNVHSFIAKHPKPDDVVPVAECEKMPLDGCFIGACTTTEEDLILGALVLEQGLKSGLKPVSKGNRRVVPGSLPIHRRLRELGLLDIYEACGYEIGVPGCSYCVGSFAYLASAATVAASSFEMKVRDPHDLISEVDLERFNSLKELKTNTSLNDPESLTMSLNYVEPNGSGNPISNDSSSFQARDVTDSPGINRNKPERPFNPAAEDDVLKGKIQRLGDYIDTDALAPAEFLVQSKTNEAIGKHCLEFTHPDFRQKVDDGFNIVVAGTGFGCGSSREQAVMALLGCGVQCVIAKSFAFIFQRNMPNLGLLGITISDEAFYDSATDGTDISINLSTNEIVLGERRMSFELSQMEKELFDHGGISSAFSKFGKNLFEAMTTPKNLARAANKPRSDSNARAELQCALSPAMSFVALKAIIHNASITAPDRIIVGFGQPQEPSDRFSSDPMSLKQMRYRECRIELDFKRMNKPEKLDALEKEIRELRSSVANTASTGALPIAREQQATNASSALNPPETFQPGHQLFSAPSTASFGEVLDSRPINRRVQMHASPISLDDIVLEPEEVTKLFYIFFDKYHPHISILNPSTTPEEYHNKSALLFWTIAYIASRRNLDEPHFNSFRDGQPSPFSDWTIARVITQNNHTLVPKAIIQRLKIYQFETRTSSCMAGVPGFAEGLARPGDTFPLLALLEREFSELWASVGPELTVENSILLDGAGLHLYIFYLMETSGPNARKTALLRGYSLATGLIRRVSNLGVESDFVRYAPQVQFQILSLAAMLILKLGFSNYSTYIDIDEGKRMFHIAAQMIRETSLEDNDLQGRMSKILTQLWGGYARIGNFDEEPSLKLRTRLGASLLHDLLWTWRDAYGNLSNENSTTQGKKSLPPHPIVYRKLTSRELATFSQGNDTTQIEESYSTIDNFNCDALDLESMLDQDFLSLFSFNYDDNVIH